MDWDLKKNFNKNFSNFDIFFFSQAKRKSKSEWDLYDTKVDDVSQNLEKFVEIQQSQYFDALDTIDENEEESDYDMDELDVSFFSK